MEKQREKHWGEGKNGIPKNWGTTTNVRTSIMRIPEREEREKGTKEIFEATMTEHLPQVNLIHQTIDAENSENTKQDKNYTCEKRKNYT